jgi:hypothetical protein
MAHAQSLPATLEREQLADSLVAFEVVTVPAASVTTKPGAYSLAEDILPGMERPLLLSATIVAHCDEVREVVVDGGQSPSRKAFGQYKSVVGFVVGRDIAAVNVHVGES